MSSSHRIDESSVERQFLPLEHSLDVHVFEGIAIRSVYCFVLMTLTVCDCPTAPVSCFEHTTGTVVLVSENAPNSADRSEA
jgi:hypothetical protein